jgi:hypothetical protein
MTLDLAGREYHLCCSMPIAKRMPSRFRGETFWLRAAQFKATISGTGDSWEEDAALRELGRGLVLRLHSAKRTDQETDDYPTFDLPGAFKGGQTFEFKWRAPAQGPWRLCLLYSKDTATPLLPEGTERFEDEYEVIGPELRP